MNPGAAPRIRIQDGGLRESQSHGTISDTQTACVHGADDVVLADNRFMGA